MTTTYLDDATYHRMLDVILDTIGGRLGGEHRDRLMFAIGEEASVWLESTREENSRSGT